LSNGRLTSSTVQNQLFTINESSVPVWRVLGGVFLHTLQNRTGCPVTRWTQKPNIDTNIIF
jgi:hypothetical protein